MRLKIVVAFENFVEDRRIHSPIANVVEEQIGIRIEEIYSILS